MRFAIAALFVSVASGQTVYHFANAASPASFQEIANAIRTVTSINDVSLDVGARSLTVNGTPEQLGIAAWLFPMLEQSQGSGSFEYQVPQSADVIRVFFTAHTKTPPALQEIVNVLRTSADVNHVVPYQQLKALVVRTTPDQMALCRWLMDALDRDPGVQPDTEAHEYTLPPTFDPRGDNLVRVFYLRHMDSMASLQELVNVTRTLADINRVFPKNDVQAIVARGNPERIALTAWLVQLLDRPANAPPDTAKHEFRIKADPYAKDDDVARVFLLGKPHTPPELQTIINSVRAKEHLHRIFPFSSRGIIALRTNDALMPEVEQAIQSADK